ncbi:MAG: DNA polymerase IV [Candidatus Micrarchaeaceae archaeon]
MRTIMLIDMDSFFVACEELRKPEIRGKPVVVGADPKGGSGRGVVSTANYEARRYGIKSGMPISTAYRIKKDAIFLPVDEPYYESISRRVMAIIRGFSEKFEQVSIDEAYIDVTGVVKDYEDAVAYAASIKEKILAETGLKCSVGIGPNKLIAKMACEAAKPNGIRLVKEDEAKQFLADMPIEKLYGVGRKGAEKLRAMGFKKIADIANANPVMLFENFGAYGIELSRSANGIDESEVISDYTVKSIGRELTFDVDTVDMLTIRNALKKMSEEVAEELKRQGFSFKRVTLKIRYSNFDEHLKSKTISYISNSAETIYSTAISIYSGLPHEKLVRKIGVRVSSLEKYKGQRKIRDYL